MGFCTVLLQLPVTYIMEPMEFPIVAGACRTLGSATHMNQPATCPVEERLFSKSPDRAQRAHAVWWSGILLVAAGISVAFVYFKIFSLFQGYDDEGFVLVSLKSFLSGKPLYDEVYSSFQPGFYVFNWLVFAGSGARVSHDNIRLLTLFLWIAAAGLNGIITHRLTGNGLIALVVSVLSVRAFEPFANEPGHPQTLAYTVIAGLVCLCAFGEALPPKAFAAGAGALVGVALLIKINIGIFVALPIALLFAAGDSRKLALAVKVFASLLMLIFPTLLWRTQLAAKGTPIWTLATVAGLALVLGLAPRVKQTKATRIAVFAWSVIAFTVVQLTPLSAQSLPVFNAGLLTLSFAGVILIFRDNREPGPIQAGSWKWACGSFAVVAIGVIGFVLIRGTSLHGLAQGLYWWPARVSSSFLIRPRSNALGSLLGIVGAVACYAYLVWRSRFGAQRWFRVVLVFAQISFGALVLAEFYLKRNGSSTLVPLQDDLPHFWMLPFAWLAAISDTGKSSTRFGRVALVLIAVVQPLIACPVAGTQLVPASILLLVVAAVSLTNSLSAGFRSVADLVPSPALRLGFASVGATALLVPFAQQTLRLRTAFASLTPLNLPGAARIRLTSDEVRVYHQIVDELSRPEVETFITLPGMDSFYLWAQKEPPNGLNVSAWMILLDAPEQERIWRAAQTHQGLMAVRNRRLIRSWVGGRSIAQLPLVRHIDENFVQVADYGGYEMLQIKHQN